MFERVVKACVAAGIIGGEGFAVEATLRDITDIRGLVTALSRSKMTRNRPRASFGTLWQLGEVICNREPWRFACDVNMKLRSNARVVIQSTERQAIVRGVSVKLADYWGAAYPAKASMIPRGRFVEGNKVLALHPFELGCSYACAGSKRGSLGLAAHRAMTI